MSNGSLSRLTATHLFAQRNLPSDIPSYIRQQSLDVPIDAGALQLATAMWGLLSAEEKEQYSKEVKIKSREHLQSKALLQH